MKWDEVARVCWFDVPMCSGFGVGAVGGPAVPSVFGEDRRSSPSGFLGLAGEQVVFFHLS